MATAPLRWGIMGTGNIARKFAQGLGQGNARLELVAVGSRHADSAAAFAREFGPHVRAHASYQALLEDDQVEVVYVSLLNHLHAELSVKALARGKHVLCEKPATMTARELEGVLATARANRVFFMEGFLYRCHPRWARLRELIADGAIGTLRLLQASFCFDGGGRADGRLLTLAYGGGALMDVGCYPISWLRWMAGAEPVATSCSAHIGETGVDEWSGGQLLFPDGVLGSFVASIRVAAPPGAALHGSRGWIEVTEPYRCTPGSSAFIVHPQDGPPRTVVVEDDGTTRYTREALEVADHIADLQSPVMTWADSLGQARTLDALRHQAGVRWPGEPEE